MAAHVPLVSTRAPHVRVTSRPTLSSVPAGTIQRCGDHACLPGRCLGEEQAPPRLGARAEAVSDGILNRRTTAVPPLMREAQAGSGHPLDQPTRSSMESRFGHDFGDVRVHTDASANRSARAMFAQAYTLRNHIYFAEGHFQPSSTEGRTLLAHELVHVLQQRDSSPAGDGTVTPQSHPAEVEARALSGSATAGFTATPTRVTAGLAPGSVALQISPRAVYCSIHALVCLGLSENPPAAALCWLNFSQRCAGGVASAEGAQEGQTPAPGESMGGPEAMA